MANRPFAVDASEWFDTVQPGAFAGTLPDANINYAYAGMRLISWFPIVNSRGASYLPEDISDELISSLPYSLANLRHDKEVIVGTIISAVRTDQGVDVAVQIDRECAQLQGFDIEAMREGNYFSHVSVELTRDLVKSRFIVVDAGFNILRSIPVLQGRKAGIRRTTAADPYLYQGNRVVELIVPERFTGLGFVPNPSDTNAELYALAADDVTEDKLLTAPVQTEVTSKKDSDINMSVEEAKALTDSLERLETELAAMRSEKEVAATAASTSATRITELETQVANLTSQVTVKETELASATTELNAFKLEKETAANEAKVTDVVSKLEAIHPCKDDVERAALREVAAHYVTEGGEIKPIEMERKILALEAANAVLEAKVAADPGAAAAAAEAAAAEAAAATAASEKELASAGDTFTIGTDPALDAAGNALQVVLYKGIDVKQLNRLS